MKNMSKMLRSRPEGQEEEIVLGLVILPHPGRKDEAVRSLEPFPSLQLGTAESHRVPAVVQTRMGEDETLLDSINALPAVMHVDVVFAQVLAEELP
jgi:nitrate reductase NapAB chaperone NapD